MSNAKPERLAKTPRSSRPSSRRRAGSQESDRGKRHTQRPGSPSRPRKFLKSSASSGALPHVSLSPCDSDSLVDQGPRLSRSPTRNEPSGLASKTFLVRPMQRRTSSNETLAPFHMTSSSTPSMSAFQSNAFFSSNYRESRNDTTETSSLAWTAGKCTPTGSFIAPGPSGSIYVGLPIPNGPSAFHHMPNSVPLPSPLPAHPPPAYDVVFANPAVSQSPPRTCPSSPQSSNSHLRLSDLHHLHPDSDSLSESTSSSADSALHKDHDAIYTISRRRKGKSRAMDGRPPTKEAIPPLSTTPKANHNRNIATRLVRFSFKSWRGQHKGTHRDEVLPGETETETDELARQASRQFRLGLSDLRWRRTNSTGSNASSNGPLSPLATTAHSPPPHDPDGDEDPSLKFTINLNKLTPFFFQFSRFLSVIPSLFGLMFCIWQMVEFNPQAFQEEYRTCVSDPVRGRVHCNGPPVPDKVDWFVAGLWAILTAYHCLGLTTGLLLRWKLYYPPLATLVRLLGLQGICWPATHLTLSVVGGVRRPVVAWAIIGTTTAVSRSIQIWVTSNIVWIKDKSPSASTTASTTTEDAALNERHDGGGHDGFFNRVATIIGGDDSASAGSSASPGQAYRRRERRWDWRKVGLRCLLPTGFLYVIMAWTEIARREWESQYPNGRGGMFVEPGLNAIINP